MIQEAIRKIKDSLPDGTELVAVSKFRPLEQLRCAYDAGQRHFAESRPLEFEAKVKAMPDDTVWHFIGHLQTNKLRHVLPYAHLVHSVDSIHLLDAIQRYAATNSLHVNVLLEVHIGREETKQGFTPEQVLSLCGGGFSAWPDVTVCGLMGMASHTDDAAAIEEEFSLMEGLFKRSRLRELSIGMSGDWQIAIRHSATMVRIGSAIFE